MMGKFSLILLFAGVALYGQEDAAKPLTPQQVQSAYYSMHYTAVIQMVKTELENHPSQTPEDLTQYLKYLAMALFAEDGEEAARGALASLLLVDPAFEFSEDEASPKIRALLESMRPQNGATVSESAPTYITLQDRRSAEYLASLVLPGRGQLQRHERRGYAYAAAYVLSVGGAIFYTRAAYRDHAAYLQAYDPNDIRTKYSAYNRSYQLRNNLWIVSAAVYLTSLLDLYFTAE